MVDFDGYDEDNYLAHKRAEEAVIDFWNKSSDDSPTRESGDMEIIYSDRER